MRITCPSCKAQYEIDQTLLPEDGREVQCSACGTVWFQDHPTTLTLRNPIPAAPPEPAAAAPAPEVATAPDAEEESTAPMGEMPPKPVDEKILDILREEAAFEAEQRAREASVLETQPDLGLASPAPWPSTPPAEAKADTSKAAESAEPKSQPFPDIEDISASLEPIKGGRGRAQDGVSVPPTSAERSSSFLRGLTLPLVAAAILVGFYLGAPMIAEAVPALAPIAESYVVTVDDLRRSVAGLIGQ